MSTMTPEPQITVEGRYHLHLRPCLRCGKPFMTTCSVRICDACHRVNDHVRNRHVVCVAELSP